MPKSSKVTVSAWQKVSVKDPRVAMRALIGVLLVANLVAAVVVFKPFGGSADDLRKDQARFSTQLRQMKTRLEDSRRFVGNIEIARTEGDDFMDKFIMEQRSLPEITLSEMTKDGTDAGVRILPETFNYEPIEGSDTLQMVSIMAPFEGNYAGLTKLVNMLEKSPRFFIIDSMNLNAPQQTGPQAMNAAQNVNVTVKLITFVRQEAVATP